MRLNTYDYFSNPTFQYGRTIHLIWDQLLDTVSQKGSRGEGIFTFKSIKKERK
jgi:hypothetical protein